MHKFINFNRGGGGQLTYGPTLARHLYGVGGMARQSLLNEQLLLNAIYSHTFIVR